MHGEVSGIDTGFDNPTNSRRNVIRGRQNTPKFAFQIVGLAALYFVGWFDTECRIEMIHKSFALGLISIGGKESHEQPIQMTIVSIRRNLKSFLIGHFSYNRRKSSRRYRDEILSIHRNVVGGR